MEGSEVNPLLRKYIKQEMTSRPISPRGTTPKLIHIILKQCTIAHSEIFSLSHLETELQYGVVNGGDQ